MATTDSPDQLIELLYKLATRKLAVVDHEGNYVWQMPTDSPNFLSTPVLGFQGEGQLEWGQFHVHKDPYTARANISGTPTEADYNYLLEVLRYHDFIEE